MFRKSFKNIVKKPIKEIEDMPLVASITMEKLETEDKVEVRTQTPLICKFCGGILVDYTKLESKGDSFKWKCEFCGNDNNIEIKNSEEKKIIEEKKGITSEELSILFQEMAKDQSKPEDHKEKSYGDTLVAIIDISGSMSGGKLEAVKHSLVQTVKDIKVNAANTIFSLITFTDFVEVYSTPEKSFKMQGDNDLFSKDNMRKTMQKELRDLKIGPVGEFGDKWITRIQGLQTIGWTALGPGLFAGEVLIEEKILKNKKVSARIILLTDGLANQGMGAVENVDPAKASKFYEEIGKDCLKSGIIIDLIGVQTGNAVALDIVGKITDITGGEMILISSEQIEAEFSRLSGKNYIARDTILRVFMPDYITLDGISGTYLTSDIPKKPGEPIVLGALDKDREIYLKFKQNKEVKMDKVPIQIQLEYLDQNNQKKYRVVKSYVNTTDNLEDYKKQYDAELYANMEIQSANQMMKEFKKDEAKAQINQLKQKLSSNIYAQNASINAAQEMLDFEEKEWEEDEKYAFEQSIKDVKSYSASKGQSKARMSMDMRKEIMKKKK